MMYIPDDRLNQTILDQQQQLDEKDNYIKLLLDKLQSQQQEILQLRNQPVESQENKIFENQYTFYQASINAENETQSSNIYDSIIKNLR